VYYFPTCTNKQQRRVNNGNVGNNGRVDVPGETNSVVTNKTVSLLFTSLSQSYYLPHSLITRFVSLFSYFNFIHSEFETFIFTLQSFLGPCHFSRWPLCSFLKKMYDQWQRCCNESQQWNSCSQSNTQCCTPNSTACSNDYCSWGWTCNENTTNNTRTSPNTNKNETKTSQNNDNKQQPQNEQPQLYPNINNDRVKIQDAPDENWQSIIDILSIISNCFCWSDEVFCSW
jgi:hypothetical protein